VGAKGNLMARGNTETSNTQADSSSTGTAAASNNSKEQKLAKSNIEDTMKQGKSLHGVSR
jgi:hypothetical protein